MVVPHNPDEMIANVDVDDNVISKGTRKEIHEKEQLHREAASYIFKHNQVLLQKRKDSGRWDHSCAGHFPAEQTYEEAIVRECEEELGVKLNFEEIAHERLATNFGRLHDRFVKIFIAKTELKLEEFKIDSGEITEIKFFTVEELKELIKNEEITTDSLRKVVKKHILPLLILPIGFSTGSVYSWVTGIENKLRLFKQLNMDAIEIIFPTPESLDQEVSEEMIAYVNSLSYVSIHAPFYLKEKQPMEYTQENNLELFEKLKKWYDLFNAQALTIHQNLIADWEFVDQSELNICIENLPTEENVSIEDMNQVIEQHKIKHIVLDTAHALTHNSEELGKLINNFKGRIQHIHFSDRRYSEIKNKVRDHEQLLFCKDISKFNQLKELNIPIIIEVSIKDLKNDLDNLQKEIDCVRNFFD